ncbi:penicillin-insensitive murein endopeptidase [Marinicella sediminis]|uniref:Penicillin-insensitive murein endopeptidase n=1 Tax=Marinicella sediminis TaxID=1792834 RepID=A0ABV7JBV9_9GAMM|nr:penicillin-insensitive murein endopeptidase [Marinicella sediminis]
MRLITLLLLCVVSPVRADSVCRGQSHQGSIEGAVRLPASGENFVVFSELAWHLGRTHVHHQVAEVVMSSYTELVNTRPGTQYMYAETGWPQGGRFKPHRTHQNGLSVDFMVPVLKDMRSVLLPVSISNRWGYDLEFNAEGQMGAYRIDYAALADHLKTLHQHAVAAGFDIKKVILDPRLQPAVLDTPAGAYLREHITFNHQQVWVRHDEHYHVDFAIPCQPLP